MPLPQSPRLHFAELVPEDAPFILELVNEPGWLQHIGDRHIHTLDAALGYISKGPALSYANNGFGLYRVSLKGNGDVVGLCGLIRRDTLAHPDVGYAFLQRHAGQGYATEAAAAVLRHAVEVLCLNELLAITSLDNHASIRVLEKIGFRYEGVMQDATNSSSKLFRWNSSVGIHAGD